MIGQSDTLTKVLENTRTVGDATGTGDALYTMSETGEAIEWHVYRVHIDNTKNMPVAFRVGKVAVHKQWKKAEGSRSICKHDEAENRS